MYYNTATGEIYDRPPRQVEYQGKTLLGSPSDEQLMAFGVYPLFVPKVPTGKKLGGFIIGVDRVDQALVDMTPEEVAAQEQALAAQFLRRSDADMARVVEDVVKVLIDKGVITMDDLPQAAQDKIASREAARVIS